MRNEVKHMWLDSLLLTLAISLPILFVSEDPLVRYVVSLIVDLIIVWYFGSRLGKAGVFDKENQEMNIKHFLILLPTCIMFLAVPISCLITPEAIVFSYSEYFWLSLLEAVLISLSEEMFFRIIVYNRINKDNRLLKIIISAGIFALFDLILFFQTFDLIGTIISMFVSFILGIFLGFIIEYTHCIYPCFIFHFLYIFFSSTYMDLFFVASDIFFILDLVLPVIGLIYLVIIYLVYFRKRETVINVF